MEPFQQVAIFSSNKNREKIIEVVSSQPKAHPIETESLALPFRLSTLIPQSKRFKVSCCTHEPGAFKWSPIACNMDDTYQSSLPDNDVVFSEKQFTDGLFNCH